MRKADARVRLELYQGGQMVAAVDAPKSDALREIRHYAMMYAQDGPCTIKVKSGKVDLREVFGAAPPAPAGRERE